MRNFLWTAGSGLVAITLTVLVISRPAEAAALLGAAIVVLVLLSLPRNKIGSFALAVAVTLTVIIPASEFTGTFRQMLSLSAVLIMAVGYIRSDIRRPVSKALWLIPLWLVLLGLGDLSTDGVVKWLVYSALVILAALLATRANGQPVFRWIVGLAVFEVAVGALQVLAGFKLPWAQITPILGNEILGAPWSRASGTMGHALPLTFLLIAAFVILLRDPAWLPRIVRFPIFAILAVGVVLTGSRSGALVLGFAVLFAVGRKITTGRVFFGTMAAVATILVAISSGFFASQAFEGLMASGSVYHRQGAFEAFGNLWNDQGAKEVLLGRGYAGVPAAFDLGLLQTDGFNVVDNQFITLIVTSGFLGCVLFITLLLNSLWNGSSSVRWVLLVCLGMFLIFDVLLWTSATVLLMIALGFAQSQDSAPVARADTDDQPQLSRSPFSKRVQ